MDMELSLGQELGSDHVSPFNQQHTIQPSPNLSPIIGLNQPTRSPTTHREYAPTKRTPISAPLHGTDGSLSTRFTSESPHAFSLRLTLSQEENDSNSAPPKRDLGISIDSRTGELITRIASRHNGADPPLPKMPSPYTTDSNADDESSSVITFDSGPPGKNLTQSPRLIPSRPSLQIENTEVIDDGESYDESSPNVAANSDEKCTELVSSDDQQQTNNILDQSQCTFATDNDTDAACVDDECGLFCYEEHTTKQGDVVRVKKYFCPFPGDCHKNARGSGEKFRSRPGMYKHADSHLRMVENLDHPLFDKQWWTYFDRDYCLEHGKTFKYGSKTHLDCHTLAQVAGIRHHASQTDLISFEPDTNLSRVSSHSASQQQPHHMTQPLSSSLLSMDQIRQRQSTMDLILDTEQREESLYLDAHNMAPAGLPTIDDIFALRSKHYNALPRFAVSDISALYMRAFRNIRKHNDLKSWLLLFAIPKLLLFASDRGGRSKHRWFRKNLEHRIELFTDLQIAELWQRAMSRGQHQKARTNQHISHQYLAVSNKKRAQYYATNGAFSKAKQALLSHGVAPLNDTVVDRLQTLHPPEDEIKCQAADYIKKLEVDPELVRIIIMKADRTTSAGPDALKPWYLKQMALGPQGTEFVLQLSRLIERVVNGGINAEVRPYFASANLTALYKDGQRNDAKVRPVAAGNTLRRIASSVIGNMHRTAIRAALYPINLGAAAVKCGIESVIHSVNMYRAECDETDSGCVAKADFANCYNSINRAFMRDAIQEFAPDSVPYYDATYGQHSYLYLKDGRKIISQTGCQQGDPLSVDLCPMAIEYLHHIHPELQQFNVMKLWLQDDGTILGPTEQTIGYIMKLNEVCGAGGLRLKPSKQEFYLKNHDVDIQLFHEAAEQLPDIKEWKVARDLNFPLLGSFCGDRESTELFLKSRADQIEKEAAIITTLDTDPQIAQLLLSYTATYCKSVYFIRTIHTAFSVQFARRLDEIFTVQYNKVLGVLFSGQERDAMALSPRFHGLGLRYINLHRIAARISSLISSFNILQDIANHHGVQQIWNRQIVHYYQEIFDNMSLLESISDVFMKLNDPDFVEEHEALYFDDAVSSLSQSGQLEQLYEDKIQPQIQDNAHKLKYLDLLSKNKNSFKQNYVSGFLDGLQFSAQLHEARGYDLIRMRASAQKRASVWIMAVPFKKNKFDSMAWKTCMLQKMGKQILEREQKCKMCTATMDIHGLHAFLCSKSGDRIRRHDEVRDILIAFAAKALWNPQKEVGHVLEGKMRLDFIIRNYDGHDTAFDVYIRTPWIDKDWTGSQMDGKHSIREGEKVKNRKYREKCRKAGLRFIPLVWNAFGTPSNEIVKLVNKLANSLEHRMDYNKAQICNFIHQKIGACIAKNNANALLRRI